MQPNKQRWMELLITVALSTLSSIIAMTWVLSARVAHIDELLADHQRHIDHTENLISEASKYGAATNDRSLVENAEISDIKVRLARIEGKLDESHGRTK